jgi:hypothetical protein
MNSGMPRILLSIFGLVALLAFIPLDGSAATKKKPAAQTPAKTPEAQQEPHDYLTLTVEPKKLGEQPQMVTPLIGVIATPLAEAFFKLAIGELEKYLSGFEATYSAHTILDDKAPADFYRCKFKRTLAFNDPNKAKALEYLSKLKLDSNDIYEGTEKEQPDGTKDGRWDFDACIYEFYILHSQAGKSIKVKPFSFKHIASKARTVPNIPFVAKSQVSIITTIRQATAGIPTQTDNYVIPPIESANSKVDLVTIAKNKKAFVESDWIPAPQTGASASRLKSLKLINRSKV